jgi:hypothetical protein
MFAGEAKSLPTFQVLRSRVGSWPHLQTLDWLERLARDKHSSILRKSVNYGCKKLYRIGPWLKIPHQQQSMNAIFLTNETTSGK